MYSARHLRALFTASHPPLSRSISATPRRDGIFDKIKGVFTGNKPEPSAAGGGGGASFTLTEFADQMDRAGVLEKFKNLGVGGVSRVTIADQLKKSGEILRYLGRIDPSGQNLQIKHKQDAIKHCNCTIADVEHILAKYTWAKEAQTKLEKLQKEGKPMPKNFEEVIKLMGSKPNVGMPNLANAGQISRNSLCPCGSKKKYKRCCGEKTAVAKN